MLSGVFFLVVMKMNDRELLELAAKAAGLVIGFSKTSPEQGRPYIWNDEKKKDAGGILLKTTATRCGLQLRLD